MSCNAQWPVVDLKINVIQNGRLEHVPDYVSSTIIAGQRLKTFAKDS